MVLNLGLLYLLASCVLFAIAAIVHFRTQTLSLPLAAGITVLVALLPLAALFNTALHPRLLRAAARPHASALRRLAPAALQLLQALLATVLGTLLLQDARPGSPTARCLLEGRWQALYSAHDAPAIRAVQDALACCGFNSVRDRAFPFQGRCDETFGRTEGCRAPWAAALRGGAGADFAVVLVVGLMQAFGLIVMRERPGWWAWRPSSPRRSGLTGGGERAGGGGGGGEARENRPLLSAAAEDEEAEVVERQEQIEHGGYRALDDGEEAMPRVLPSGMGHERNAWAE
ncbi:hypothetical protein ESCO_001702 [Escovopsis weberi]|uniref:Uncharacterized protein n=1 Tax=Escovopsis weberi TaxID=150374 RepID=A0A0N0RU63_ESCWE|nr:hypothetical protein ESCO_001702 [Escovopsis weberi]